VGLRARRLVWRSWGGWGRLGPDFDGSHGGHCGWVEDDEKMRFNGLPDQLQEKIGIGRIFR
jgi:hypothetical protein